MSSWSLLLALSGYGYSAPLRELRFSHAINADNFRALYTTGSAWGSYAQKATSEKLDAEIRVEEGTLTLATLRLPAPKAEVKVVSKARATVRVEKGEAIVTFDKPVEIKAGGKLAVTLA